MFIKKTKKEFKVILDCNMAIKVLFLVVHWMGAGERIHIRNFNIYFYFNMAQYKQGVVIIYMCGTTSFETIYEL